MMFQGGRSDVGHLSAVAGSSGRMSDSFGGGSFSWGVHDGELALAFERTATGEAGEEDAAERVDVGSCVERSALDLLGRDVVDRADEPPVAGQAAGRGEVPGEAEVADVRMVALRGCGDQDVARLHVAVHEPCRVGRVEGAAQDRSGRQVVAISRRSLADGAPRRRGLGRLGTLVT